MQPQLPVKRAAVGLLVAGALATLAWFLASPADAWSPEQRAPRPTQCPPGPHLVDFAFPWPEEAHGQFETPLSANGCLRLREERRSSRRRRWQVLELEPDGGERVVLEADFSGDGPQQGSVLVLQQPYAPEPMPAEWRERNFTRLAWFAPGVRTERRFDSARHEVVELRTTDAGVERSVVVLPEANPERNPNGPRERYPDH